MHGLSKYLIERGLHIQFKSPHPQTKIFMFETIHECFAERIFFFFFFFFKQVENLREDF